MQYKDKKYHFIYKTKCVITGKFYIGMHSTDDLNDGYLGSGKRLSRSINKYGKENHYREILEFSKTRKDLELRELDILDEKILENTECLNLIGGGTGGNRVVWSEERRLKQSTMLSGRIFSDEHKENIKKSLTGNPLSEERKQNISKSVKALVISDEEKTRRINKCREKTLGKSRYTWILSSPDNNIISISSLSTFCRENNLDYNKLYNSRFNSETVKEKLKNTWQIIDRYLNVIIKP